MPGESHSDHWEQGRRSRQRFECLKCQPHPSVTVHGLGDDPAWQNPADLDS